MNQTRTTNAFVGSPVERIEDLRFLRGRGQFVDDLARDNLLHAVILRSAAAGGWGGWRGGSGALGGSGSAGRGVRLVRLGAPERRRDGRAAAEVRQQLGALCGAGDAALVEFGSGN